MECQDYQVLQSPLSLFLSVTTQDRYLPKANITLHKSCVGIQMLVKILLLSYCKKSTEIYHCRWLSYMVCSSLFLLQDFHAVFYKSPEVNGPPKSIAYLSLLIFHCSALLQLSVKLLLKALLFLWHLMRMCCRTCPRILSHVQEF